MMKDSRSHEPEDLIEPLPGDTEIYYIVNSTSKSKMITQKLCCPYSRSLFNIYTYVLDTGTTIFDDPWDLRVEFLRRVPS